MYYLDRGIKFAKRFPCQGGDTIPKKIRKYSRPRFVFSPLSFRHIFRFSASSFSTLPRLIFARGTGVPRRQPHERPSAGVKSLFYFVFAYIRYHRHEKSPVEGRITCHFVAKTSQNTNYHQAQTSNPQNRSEATSGRDNRQIYASILSY